MDIDWVQITRREFDGILAGCIITNRNDLSHEDPDNIHEVYQFSKTELVCHDTINLYDEHETYGHAHYYFKGLIR